MSYTVAYCGECRIVVFEPEENDPPKGMGDVDFPKRWGWCPNCKKTVVFNGIPDLSDW